MLQDGVLYSGALSVPDIDGHGTPEIIHVNTSQLVFP